jgi:CheY-like chemotaxis protein
MSDKTHSTQIKARVLLVDDEPAMLRMLKSALGLYGYETAEAIDGGDALDLLRQQSFDVVVSDVHMPGYPGLEFLETMRARGYTIPVIMISGKPSPEVAKIALEHGAFRYLIKPVMPPILKQAIDQAILFRRPQ